MPRFRVELGVYTSEQQQQQLAAAQAAAAPKKRRGRKPKVPRVEGVPGEYIETKFVEENINKRKHGVSSQWTDGDRGE